MSTLEGMRLLKREEIEEKFGIPKRFLEVSANRGDGPPIVRIGRSVRYRLCDIRDWLEAKVENSS